MGEPLRELSIRFMSLGKKNWYPGAGGMSRNTGEGLVDKIGESSDNSGKVPSEVLTLGGTGSSCAWSSQTENLANCFSE